MYFSVTFCLKNLEKQCFGLSVRPGVALDIKEYPSLFGSVLGIG